MALQRLDSIIDVQAIEKEAASVEAVAQRVIGNIKSMQAAVKQYAGATPGNIGSETSNLGGKVTNTKNSQDELAAAKAKLNKLYTEEAQRLAAVNIQIAAQRKANSDAAKETLGLNDAYSKLNKQYIDAQRNAKNLAATQGLNSKATQDATKHANELSEKLKAIDKSVGQNNRNVGNYAESLKEGVSGLLPRLFGVANRNVSNYAEGLKEGLGGLLPTLSGLALGAATVEKAFEFFKDSIKEFEENERALTGLRNILSNSGREDAFEGLAKDAEEIAKQFKVIKDEDVVHVFDQLATFGGLTQKQFKELTPVIIDFAQKQGVSLSEATDTILKALEGQGRALKTYGIQLDKNATVADNFGVIMTQLGPKVKGATEAFAGTLEGTTKQVEIQIDELKKSIGEEFAPLLQKFEASILEGVKGIPDLFTSIGHGVDSVLDKVKEFFLLVEKLATFGQSKNLDAYEAQKKALEETVAVQKERNEIEAYGASFAATYANKSLKDQQAQLAIQLKIQKADQERFALLQASGALLSAEGREYAKRVQQDEAIVKSLQKGIDATADKRTIGKRVDQAKEHKDNTDAINQEIEAQAKLNALRLQSDIDLQNALAEGKSPIKARLAANEAALALEIKAINDAKDVEVTKTKLGENQKELIIETAQNNILKKEIEYGIKRGKIIKDNADDQAALIKESNEHFKQLDADRQKARLDSITNRGNLSQDSIDESRDYLLKNAAERFNKGITTEKQYQEERKKIERQADLDILNARLATDQALLAEAKTTGDQQASAAKVAADKRAIAELKAGNKNEDEDKAKAKKEQITQGLEELGAQFADLSRTIIDAGYQKQLDAIQKVEDEDQKAKANQIQRVEASTASEQDKAAKVAIINAQAQAQEDQLNLRRRKIQHDQAVADKAFNVASAIENGIVASLSALKTGGPIYAAIVAAIAAVGVAKLIATPIPAYAEGTHDHPGGIARYGERGSELVMEPGKPARWVHQDTVAPLARHTRVMPRKEVDRLMQMGMSNLVVDQRGILKALHEPSNGEQIKEAIVWQTEQLKRALTIKNKPVVVNNSINVDRIKILEKKVFK